MNWQTILAIGSGGFIGAVMRAYLSGSINKNFPHELSLGTLSVNILGSFILGGLFAVILHTEFFSPSIRLLLTTGIMGALTTYSTFALETFLLFNKGSFALGVVSIILNVGLTILATGASFKAIEHLLNSYSKLS